MTASDIPASMTVPRFVGGGRVEFVEKPVPTPGPGQLLIAVKANALCRSELRLVQEGTPVTLGHEAVGVVAAAGPGASHDVGTLGVIFLMDFCGQCRSCRLGFTNQCLATRGDYGFNRDGGYGAYELVNENVFFPIDPDLPPAEATMLLDIMSTGGHALRRARLVRPDVTSVLVTGAGPIGLGLLAMTKLVLGRDIPVFISDLVPYRLAMAERLGGLPIDVSRTSLQEGLGRHGHDRVDLAIDGSGRATARRSALDVLAKRGVLVCVGHGEDLHLTVSPDLIGAERAVLGSEYFCFNELPASLALLKANREYLSQIVTHRYPVREIERAFAEFVAGNTGKVVIEQ